MVSFYTKYFLLRVDDTWTNVCVQHVLACVRHMATHAKDERVGGLVLEVHGTYAKATNGALWHMVPPFMMAQQQLDRFRVKSIL